MRTFEECVKNGGLKESEADKRIAEKELTAARNDLESSKRSLKGDDWHWAIVQAYYSAFHSAKALLISRGWRERSHECVPVALKRVFSSELPEEKAEFLNNLRFLRLKANYELYEFHESSAKHAVEGAEEFLQTAERILEENKK